MIPVIFGPPERPLLGTYHAAAGGARGGRAMLLCAPHGLEYTRAHRALRILADQLARERWHVLRFDWSGTGDSAGALEEARVERWLADLEAARAELEALSGVSRVALGGLRLGATVAALACRGDAPVPPALVLWDPVTDGAGYLRELGGEGAAGGEVEPTRISNAFATELNRIDASSLGRGVHAESVLVVWTRPSVDRATLERGLGEHGARVDVEEIDAPLAWTEEHDFGTGPIPGAVLQRIASWRA